MRKTTSVRKARAVGVLCSAFVVTITPAPVVSASPVRAGLPVGGFTSEGVSWVTNVPLSGLPTATGGRLVGRYFYVRGLSNLEIYDVSKPLDPVRVGVLDLAAPCTDALEDPDTNGKILLFTVGCPTTRSGGTLSGDLHVIDVTDKTAPQVIATLGGQGSHTYSCILDCKWAYGSHNGNIVDLRDPSNPKVLKRSWSAQLSFFNPPGFYTEYKAHDVTEVAPGIILTASTPMYVLDARADPTRPQVVARSDGSPYSFGGTAWPNRGTNRIVLSWSEALQTPRCEMRDAGKNSSLDSAFKTWDSSGWKRTGLLTGSDVYYVDNGTYTDGEPAFSGGPPGVGGCSASWFDVHPDFDRNGGLVAHAASGHGVKFLDISRTGRIAEKGYFLPHGGNTVAAYWITDEIVYTTDGHRGIDILRFETLAR